MWKELLLAGCIMAGSYAPVTAQGYVDQDGVAPVLETQGSSIEAVQPVSWHVYKFGNGDKNSKVTLQRLQAHLDALPGGMQGHRLEVVELTNRICRKYLMQRQELLVPDSFADDFRAYAPYPQTYDAASSLPKLFVIDKYSQTFGAYENGTLVRWGLISSGHDDDLTPDGRYSFNWKAEYRESSEAPLGEVWKLRWVFNFCAARGIHVHQYQLPIAMAASHGCVRLSESDAKWNFNWADAGTGKATGTPVIVINHNPGTLSAHWMLVEGTSPISLVNLPTNPMEVPASSEQVAGR